MAWIVALVEAVALVVVASTMLRAIASMQRQHARREDLLIAQLLHATGHTWTPPPVDEAKQSPADRGFTPPAWTPTPEQLPVD